MTSDADVQARRQALLAWYDEIGRDLPWRRTPSLYGTWVSEIMLQQTTVKAVIPRWESFVGRFPDVRALAEATETEVLAAWSGLGYYRRARLLHAAARRVVADLDGMLPRTVEEWRALPGVGEYAAGAIASIGLGLVAPAVDANVRRVLARWVCDTPEAAKGLRAASMRNLAASLVDPDRPGDWNQALMDLGAGPCRTGRADCPQCPVRTWCAAGRADSSASVPPTAPRRETIPVLMSSLVLRSAGRVLLLPSERAVVSTAGGLGRPARRTLDGLFGGMVNLPSTPWYRDPGGRGDDGFPGVWRRWLRGLGWPRPTAVSCGIHRHVITVHRLRVAVFAADWPHGPQPVLSEEDLWAEATDDGPLSTLAKRCLDRAIANDL